ncbi:hypothetical protein K458DRAFT_436696 [Lentithecium fluviatile CBS 122367]|uniref:Uncharacterized protein n=1 Tax=Lentithecium fluviatile CBS 122367 TaxID=1168545 RepID=A0A6G1IG61_9PLEO|nr:hypothetical protein K458DRAFT_436696 [Lentithecium fluviatile CBS 122367]
MALRSITALLTILFLTVLTLRSDILTNICPLPLASPSTSHVHNQAITERRFASFIAAPAMPEGSWATKQIPTKGSFLWVEHNTTSAVSWEVSMAYGLHCMSMIRRLVMGKSIGNLLCAADDTIEPATTLWADDGTVIEHTGIPHDSFVHQWKDSSHI